MNKAKLKRKSPRRPVKDFKVNSLSNDKLINLYKQMLLIRRFEEKAGQLYGMGSIGGFCHLYIGQEAVVVGMQSISVFGDSVITSYRDHGHMIACGMDPRGVMAELTGRESGYSKGKGGSMHMFSKEKNFYGGHGIVGAQVPIGVGLAFSHKYKSDGFVSMTYLGDGAVNQGQVYESFNMAALWKLPVVFIIENNKYGMGTSIGRSAAGNELFERATVFGIKGEKVDGMNFFTVSDAAIRARDYINNNSKPYIIEMDTYRFRGHSMSDPGLYRTKDEVNKMKEIDPVLMMKETLLKEYKFKEETIKDIESDIKKQIKDVEKFSLDSPLPDIKELFTEVYL